MKNKFNAYDKTLYDFIDKIYVICPSCDKQALVRSNGLNKEQSPREIKLICTACGNNKYYEEIADTNWISGVNGPEKNQRPFILGSNVDPYFHLPLWLQKELSYGVLWAYNYEHLTFLENHIQAGLRYRDAQTNDHHSIGVRLPKWMTSKKNRAEILQEISKIKRKK